MLFNSAEFLFAFVPVTLLAYIWLVGRSQAAAVWWLLAASLFFYSYWDVRFLPLLLGSLTANFALGHAINRSTGCRRCWLVLGVSANLALLGYFKYVDFLIDTVNEVSGAGLDMAHVILPLGISFFTFQQIAFLVDSYRHGTTDPSPARYALFVTFFPHLIAGPLVHHTEMIPQFGRARADRWTDVAQGGTLLVIGLIKKMVIADSVAGPSSAIFAATAHGLAPSTLEAWMAALCYALQIYFDFSAYSDMAIGIGRMFGLDLPINFASPYKARSIVDFWRRWHITLSRFLRDYLYIPLGGSRCGAIRHNLNLFVTMLLGGIWHGAGWTFVLWGALHGSFLLVNHLWSASGVGKAVGRLRHWPVVAQGITLLAVVFAWVPFRAPDMASTIAVWSGMLGLNGTGRSVVGQAGPSALAVQSGKLVDISATMGIFVVILWAIALLAPNALELLSDARMGLPTRGYPATIIPARAGGGWRWMPWHALATGVLIVVVVMKLGDVSEFIYFQF